MGSFLIFNQQLVYFTSVVIKVIASVNIVGKLHKHAHMLCVCTREQRGSAKEKNNILSHFLPMSSVCTDIKEIHENDLLESLKLSP